MFRTIRTVEPKSASEQTAYAKWLDQRSDREAGRATIASMGRGVIPTPLWIVLFISAGVIFAFMFLFADSGERAFVQAMLMGGVVVVISSTLLLLWFLDNPFHGGVGGLRPVAMERTLSLIQEESALVGGVSPPCDRLGNPRG